MTPRLLVALLLASAALPALADTYKWVDEKGQVNYSNVPPPSVAGKATAVEDKISVMGMDPAVRAWADRRFADQERADEADWQRRRQAMAAQQYARPMTASYGSSPHYSSSPYYYGSGYYYPTFVSRPVLARAVVSNPPHVSHHSHSGHSGRGSTRR